eukprot:gnl/TRDRNA2_/TRDRNA2_180772_c0_seq1.p1 gnl/TRDRNA2_/TRDRNA2_180772_c0~~gnl/TRDRNA2_/TRDRNA2_180772_c0_seq1.p1  ORF type:complete len:212 (-),score=57.30 gnl/TRDRNA2_/TRDRNA2_180772_c0_seq1:115-750(-)
MENIVQSLEDLLTNLRQDSSPSILTQGTVDLVSGLKSDLAGLAAVCEKNPNVKPQPPAGMKEFDESGADIMKSIEELKSNVNGKPWQNPAALKALRKTEGALCDKVAVYEAAWRAALGLPSKKYTGRRAAGPGAVTMTSEPLAQALWDMGLSNMAPDDFKGKAMGYDSIMHSASVEPEHSMVLKMGPSAYRKSMGVTDGASWTFKQKYVHG